MAKDKLQSICHIYKSWHMNSNANSIESKLCNILYRLFSRFAPWKVNPFARCGNGVLDEYKHQNTYGTKKKVSAVSSWNHAKQYITYIDQCTQGLWNNNFMQKFENTKITIFLNSKTQSHVIQTWYENLALIPIVGNSGFVSHTKHIAEATKHGSISFKIDNMHYVNFRI